MATISWVWDRNAAVRCAPQATRPQVTETTSLASAQRGAAYVVTQVRAPGALGERLMELGLVPGTEVTVVRRGFLGNPIQIAVRGGNLSLRRAQALDVVVTDARRSRG